MKRNFRRFIKQSKEAKKGCIYDENRVTSWVELLSNSVGICLSGHISEDVSRILNKIAADRWIFQEFPAQCEQNSDSWTYLKYVL